MSVNAMQGFKYPYQIFTAQQTQYCKPVSNGDSILQLSEKHFFKFGDQVRPNVGLEIYSQNKEMSE